MTKKIQLIFGCHSHQPIGNFDHVFAEAYERAYRPFIDVLERHPAVKVTLHYTGPLLDWFEAHQPAFLERLAALVQKGQVEIMGGAYYEPMVCAIPERDSIAQIERMRAFCERHFGQRPRGMWLTERVWEPHMPRILGQAGIEYVALDDAHFKYSGLGSEDMFGYYVTEDEGYCVKVFPILEKLRYTIPFHGVQESIDFLRQHAVAGSRLCAVVHDDGEKFGIWPGTYSSVYEQGWLDSFFGAIESNQDWLQAVTYQEFLANTPSQGRIYLPTASYKEMMEWALPPEMHRRLDRVEKAAQKYPELAEDIGLFLRGGFWRNFLAKYPESNTLQKRMLSVSRRLSRLKENGSVKDLSGNLAKAEELLHKAQCNCAYWHGIFGGLYLNHLRTALYDCMIAADSLLDATEFSQEDWLRCEMLDFDGDGSDEAILANSRLWAAFDPRDGGTLFELDFKDKPFNFLNTLARREEFYHDQLKQMLAQQVDEGQDEGTQSIHEMVRAKEAKLDTFLIYDRYRRSSLRDHFFPGSTTAEDLRKEQYEEWGDFATAEYDSKMEGDVLELRRTGVFRENPADRVEIRKTVQIPRDASRLNIRYHMQTGPEATIEGLFGVEFALNLLTGAAPDRYYRSDDGLGGKPMLGTTGCKQGLRHIALRDDWQQIEIALRFDQPARVYRFPIETVSQSEGGQERIHQGSVVIPCWPLHLRAGESTSIAITIEMSIVE